jgi:hypothetical protein
MTEGHAQAPRLLPGIESRRARRLASVAGRALPVLLDDLLVTAAAARFGSPCASSVRPPPRSACDVLLRQSRAPRPSGTRIAPARRPWPRSWSCPIPRCARAASTPLSSASVRSRQKLCAARARAPRARARVRGELGLPQGSRKSGFATRRVAVIASSAPLHHPRARSARGRGGKRTFGITSWSAAPPSARAQRLAQASSYILLADYWRLPRRKRDLEEERTLRQLFKHERRESSPRPAAASSP